ncbi:MAG TPA: RHS repeat domain-containing protein, partial [Tepidisphaeraceae bacterium]
MRRTSLGNFGSGGLAYGWDDAGRQTRVADPQSKVLTSTMDALGRWTVRRNANGTTSTRAFDPAGNLTQIVNADAENVTSTYCPDARWTLRGWDASNSAGGRRRRNLPRSSIVRNIRAPCKGFVGVARVCGLGCHCGAGFPACTCSPEGLHHN